MASKRHQRRRSCEGKTGYSSRDEAITAAGKLRKSFHGGTWAAYRCQFCGNWHVGRPTAKQVRAMNDRRAAGAE